MGDFESPKGTYFDPGWSRLIRPVTANPAQVKEQYATASILKNGRVVFNIGGNKYRLVVRINYAYRVVYVRFAGTHSEYDQIDAEQM